MQRNFPPGPRLLHSSTHHPSAPKTSRRMPRHPRRPAPVPQKSVSAITPLPLPPPQSNQHTTRPPPPHPNPQESPRDARVTQAPAGAINHKQIRAAVSRRDCGWRTGSARKNARRRIRECGLYASHHPAQPETCVRKYYCGRISNET